MKKRKFRAPRPVSLGQNAHTLARSPSRPKSAVKVEWIYGLHASLAAIANPKRQTQRILITRTLAELHAPKLNGHLLEVVERRQLDAVLPPNAVHQGIAVLCTSLPNLGLNDLLDHLDPNDNALIIVLDQATDPRNIGAVIRTAAAFNAIAVLVHDHHAPPITSTLAKAASGALEIVPLIRVSNLAQGLNRLKDCNFWCLGLDSNANTVLSDATLTGRSVLVFGAEGSGLRRLTRETCDLLIKIPINSSIDSLNLSNAVAITLYETTRHE